MIQSTPESSSPQHIVCFGTTYAFDPETGGVFIPLGGKKFPGKFALVDPEDVLKVAKWGWSPFRPTLRGNRELFYAKARVRGDIDYLHRFVLGITDRKIRVDHINHDGLDCRKENLRVATHQQNVFNRRPNLLAASPYKGVYWHNSTEKWLASISCDGKRHYIGVFAFEEDAARAYDAKAAELFGEYAYLNFPEEGENS